MNFGEILIEKWSGESNFAAFSLRSCSHLFKRCFDSLGVMIGHWGDCAGGRKDRPPWSFGRSHRFDVVAMAVFTLVMTVSGRSMSLTI